MIKTKSVYSPIDPKEDGFRVLATRLHGRGLPKNRYHVWMANLGPSERLLRQILFKKISWPGFKQQYRKELFEGGSIDKRNRTIKNHGQKFTLRLLQALARRGTVTLLCHCDEEDRQCHRHVLQEVLQKKV